MSVHSIRRVFGKVGAGAFAIWLLACSSNHGSGEGRKGGEAIGTVAEALGNAPGNCTSATFGSEIYYFCSNAQTWTDSRAKCLSTPGLDLVRIESAAENTFVASKMAGESWLSANDRTTEGAWRWSVAGADDGPPFWSGTSNGNPVGGLYSNWETLQPNDLGTQDCAIIEGDAKWDDKSCTDTKSYVCEGDACPNDSNKLEPGICGCGVSEADTDGDGRVDCLDLCPQDASKGEPGDCGCSNAPATLGTACDDGLCATNNQCNGTGTCGNPADCAPAPGCTFQAYAAESGRGYFFCTGAVNWTTAKAQCEAKPGMGLARIDDSAENAFVLSKLTTASWLGANDRTSEANWKWAQPGTDKGDQSWSGGASGHTVDGLFASWKSGQPDDSGSADCARMDPTNAGGWDDASCNATAGYVCEVAASPCKGTQAGAPWPSTRRCASHDARSPFLGAQTSDLNWATALSGTTPVGSPSVGSDDTIYVAVDTKLFAVNKDGSVKWSFTAGGSIESTPAVAAYGTVYVGASDEHVYGLSPTGVKRVDEDLLHDVHSSPVIGQNGTLYVSNGDDLHALKPDGSELWHEDVGDSDGLSPAVGPGGTIYIGSRILNRMTALSPSGDELWTFGTGANVKTTAAVANDGTLYFGAGNSLFAVTPAGTQKWKYTASATVTATPAIGAGRHPFTPRRATAS